MTRGTSCILGLLALTLCCLGSAHAEEGQPEAPAASAAVQDLLDEAARLRDGGDADSAHGAAARAAESARAADDAPGLALAEEERARALEGLQRFDDAVTAWSAAETAWKAAGDGPGRVRAACGRALVLVRADEAAALAELERAAEVARAERSRPQAAARELDGAAMAAQGRRWLAGAKTAWTGALEIEERHAPDSLDVAGRLNNLGSVAARQGDLPSARSYFERALELRERHAPGSLAVAGSLSNLGNLARMQGDLVSARRYQERALELAEAHAPDSLNVARSLNNLGSVAARQGDFVSARGYFERALDLKERHAPGSLDVAGSLNNLGNVAARQGDLRAARSYFERGLELFERHAPGSRDVAASLGNLANVTTAQGDLASARSFHLRALELFERHAPGSLDVARSLNGLGNVAADQGDFASARKFQERALELRERHAPGSLDVAASLTNLGTVATDQGDLVSARGFLLRALKLKERHAPGSLAVATSLTALGNVVTMQGELESARSYLERALELLERHAPGSLDMASSLGALALASPDAPATAEPLLARGWEIIRAQARSVVGDEARQAFGSSFASFAASLVAARLELGRTEAGFEVAEQARAQALLGLMAEREADLAAAAPEAWASYREAEALMQREGERLAGMGAALAKAERDAAPPGQLESLRLGVEQARNDHAAARSDMQRHLAAVRREVPGLDAGASSLAEARRSLPKGALFASFLVGEKQTHGFLVSADPEEPLAAWSVELPAEELGRRVAMVRQVVGQRMGLRGVILASPEDRSPPRRVRRSERTDANRELFQLLFPEDVRRHVMAAERLVLSPDGALWELPFAALITNDDGKPAWLGLEKPLSYTQSLTVLALERSTPRAAPGAAPRVLVVGDAIFERGRARPVAMIASREPSSARLAPQSTRGLVRSQLWLDDAPPRRLPATREEARVVAFLHGAHALLGEEATEAAVRARLAGADIVHLATHGSFLPFAPMSSGVLLTPPPLPEAGGEEDSTENDGALQAWEVLRGPRLRAELVVLSACDTGRGRTVKGEGLVGMTRAWQGAGARSVLATHWPVADESTAALMVSFHQALRDGVAKDEALRRALAETAMRRETREPFYWAGFFLSGDTDPTAWGKPAS